MCRHVGASQTLTSAHVFTRPEVDLIYHAASAADKRRRNEDSNITVVIDDDDDDDKVLTTGGRQGRTGKAKQDKRGMDKRQDTTVNKELEGQELLSEDKVLSDEEVCDESDKSDDDFAPSSSTKSRAKR
jgi:hypothetical protein